MTIRTMVDSTGVVPPPAGVTVAAFYLPGNGASRGWPAAEVQRAKQLYAGLLPIQVAYRDFSNPEVDADRAVAQLHALGIDSGAIAIDLEANIAGRAGKYARRWSDRIRSHGRYALGYTSRSTVGVVDGCDGKWIAGYDGKATTEGYEAHQYADPGPYDLSAIDDGRVPIWGLTATAPTPPPPPFQPGPPVVTDHPEENTPMQTIAIQIATDADGNGYNDVPVDNAKVLPVKLNGKDPTQGGYPRGMDAFTLDVNGQTRVEVVNGPINGHVDATLFVMA